MHEPTDNDLAVLRDQHQRFLYHLNRRDEVYGLRDDKGFANVMSRDDDDAQVMLFWSDRDLADEVGAANFEGYEVTPIPLLGLMFDWMPSMARDGVLMGCNWGFDMIGIEFAADEMRAEIQRSMDGRKMARMIQMMQARKK